MAVGIALAASGCPPRGTTTATITGAPSTAAPEPARTDSLARAKALLTPYDPGGTSRDAVEMLLRMAKSGNTAAYAMLARTYADWTAYAAYAADAPLLDLLERDLGIAVGPGTAPFPLPRRYVERLTGLARKGADADLVSLLETWALHDLGPEYWRRLASLLGDPAAALWALMDCEAAAGAARGVPEGYAPWVMARGCAVVAPDALPLLVDSGADERRRLLREALGCDPLGDTAGRCTDPDVEAALRGPLRDVATPETVAAFLALLGRTRLVAAHDRARAAGDVLGTFAAESLAGAAARRYETPLTAAFVGLPRSRGTTVPELPQTTFGLWTDETRVVLVLAPSGASVTAKPLLVMTGATPSVDLGPAAAPYPGEPVGITRLADTLDTHFRAWEKRGLGGSTAGGARPLGRGLALAIDIGTPMRTVARALGAARGASIEAFLVVARRHDGSITEVPLRVGWLPARAAKPKGVPVLFAAPPEAVLEMRVEDKYVRLTGRHLPGVKPVTIPNHGHTPDLAAVYAAAAPLLSVASEHSARLRATAGKGVRFGDLFDAVDALRWEVLGGPFASSAAFAAARFAAAAHATAASPRRELGGPFTVVLEP